VLSERERRAARRNDEPQAANANVGMKPPVPLSLYYHGRHYDLKWRHLTVDLPFWLRQASAFGDPILELGCGTGRVALHLAQAGFRLTGIDIFESMLKEARRKAIQQKLAVEWVRDDIRVFDLGRKFALIIIPFNTLLLLPELEDLEACLACVRKHLAPGGKFIVDVFNPSLEILRRDHSKRYPHREYPAPDGGGTIVVTESNLFDATEQINHLRLYYQFPGKAQFTVEEVPVRIYFPKELAALLGYNGFVVEKRFGDYDESPFKSDSPRQLLLCSAR
jgi:SAM-dependent methyltransferase